MAIFTHPARDLIELINISHFVLDEKFRELAKRELLATFAEAEKEKAGRLTMLQTNKTTIHNKLERLEERYIDEELDRIMYEKHHHPIEGQRQ